MLACMCTHVYVRARARARHIYKYSYIFFLFKFYLTCDLKILYIKYFIYKIKFYLKVKRIIRKFAAVIFENDKISLYKCGSDLIISQLKCSHM